MSRIGNQKIISCPDFSRLSATIAHPFEFVRTNDQYIASLLMGENPEMVLHESQIQKTLKNPLSFQKNDLFIFDLDRCLIIDPNQDYEDALQIIELANYQLLELRTFDRYLDSLLDKAEDDIKELFFKRRRLLGRRIKKKFGYLFRLRYDVMFIWENLENVSKIIGDYFLSQIYNHLSELYALDDWSDIIRQRLKVLDDFYSAAKYDINERILIILEVMIVILFIIDIILVIFEFLS
ncbi:MAG: hypothetical protein EU544_04560 [Promethearchaeota archaeon]|nr:MAG: hypothetical protein EU544_04560 [Candidatus Lokiarchaeota archaeon]